MFLVPPAPTPCRSTASLKMSGEGGGGGCWECCEWLVGVDGWCEWLAWCGWWMGNTRVRVNKVNN